ncbi:MAG: ROK family protein [Clostridia bacterium]|nr:ROK family protein [Clostridia bacterium]
MRIGIDLGGSHIGVGLIDNGEILYKVEKDLQEDEKGTLKIIDLIKKILKTIIEQNELKKGKLDVIGIACPGVVENGIVRKSENLNIPEIDFKKELENDFKGIKIIVRNDTKCAALAEKEYGILKEYSNCAMLTIGTGIGGAIFYKGNLLEGRNSSAYELGHIIINKNGKKCSCGAKGCFEAYASIGSLKEEISNALKLDKRINGIDLVELIKKSDKNDISYKIFEEYIDNLCVGIASICNIFEPEAIALGGSIVYYKDLILEKLENKLKNSEYVFNKKELPKILMAKLNNDAGMIGATIL